MLKLDEVLALIRAMNDEKVEYITLGALALWTHGIPRLTEDADFFIAPSMENIARLKAARARVWDDPHIEEISAEELLADYPSVRYGPPNTELYIDFLTRLEIYPYDALEWEVQELEGVPIRVVTPLQLYRMKRHTVRPKDWGDAEALRRKFSLPEE
jgi:hypothetical protein